MSNQKMSVYYSICLLAVALMSSAFAESSWLRASSSSMERTANVPNVGDATAGDVKTLSLLWAESVAAVEQSTALRPSRHLQEEEEGEGQQKEGEEGAEQEREGEEGAEQQDQKEQEGAEQQDQKEQEQQNEGGAAEEEEPADADAADEDADAADGVDAGTMQGLNSYWAQFDEMTGGYALYIAIGVGSFLVLAMACCCCCGKKSDVPKAKKQPLIDKSSSKPKPVQTSNPEIRVSSKYQSGS